MAYQTGSATSLSNLLTTLSTFAVANGWTEDEMDGVNGVFALHKDDIYVSFAWLVATPLHLSVHQALAWSSSTDPGDHTDDSGNGYNGSAMPYSNTNILTERCVDSIGDGPFPSYHFFEDDDGTRSYLHVVVEIDTDVFRHFGMGEIDKFGDWDSATGGEYAYGQNKEGTTATYSSDTTILDGLFSDTGGVDERRAATLHMEGWPDQDGSGKWGQVWGNTRIGAEPTDSAGNPKAPVQGGFRSGPVARNFGWLKAGTTSGLINMYPIALFYDNTTEDFVYLMGYMPDVRGINIRYFTAGQELTYGADTWVVFPTSLRTTSVVAEGSYYQGIAYKKVTT